MPASPHPDLGGDLTKLVIGAAMTVHRTFGPGLDEADYERALHLELEAQGIEHGCQVPLPLIYKGEKLDCGYRMDLVVPGRLLLELKTVEKFHPMHEAQLLTYLRLSAIPLGLLMNFNTLVLRDGIVRRAHSVKPAVRHYTETPPPRNLTRCPAWFWPQRWRCSMNLVMGCSAAPMKPAWCGN